MNFAGNSLVAAIVLAAPLVAQPALAEDSRPTPHIVVTGEGTASITPDTAILTLSVVREADTARAALDANSAAMADVLAAMQEEGVAERDLQTSNFSIEPKYVYPQSSSNGDREPPRIVGYAVHNTLTVRIRNLDRLGAVLDTSVSLGVNQGGNIVFSNDDPSEAVTEARVAAMKDAMARAKTLTDAAGIGLGKVLEISESSQGGAPEPLAKVRSAMVEAASAVPVATGENTYRVTVNVSFALDQ
ncbi:SIMPL domain-containing protein [Oricola sp.]|uniref:SIMPL domain-containing protein n=1 Tax=Oricola sp. TaxID=1979950 RepID=UPI0025D2E686|nr:SIMPL domain-containing protein [Oricola sp.]MCI5076803.1 SIMPL domain-containing protein [Oricola sp.]